MSVNISTLGPCKWSYIQLRPEISEVDYSLERFIVPLTTFTLSMWCKWLLPLHTTRAGGGGGGEETRGKGGGLFHFIKQIHFLLNRVHCERRKGKRCFERKLNEKFFTRVTGDRYLSLPLSLSLAFFKSPVSTVWLNVLLIYEITGEHWSSDHHLLHHSPPVILYFPLSLSITCNHLLITRLLLLMLVLMEVVSLLSAPFVSVCLSLCVF